MMKICHFLVILFALTVIVCILGSASLVNAAEEIDAYCAVPTDSVPHGSTVPLTIKFSDSDKSNAFIAQGPFKVLRYDNNGKPIVVTVKRGNEKDKDGKDNTDKPTLTFNVVLTPKHKLPAPATESVTYTYFVSYKEGNRGALYTTNRDQQVDCSFVVQHDIDEKTAPIISGDPDFDLLRISQNVITPADLGVQDVGTLPTSRWYFFKEWRREFTRFFAWSAVAKAELELKITNEKAAEIIKVEEASPSDAEAIEKALVNYAHAQERLKARLAFIKIRDTDQSPDDAKLLENVYEKTAKHSALLNELELKKKDFDWERPDSVVKNAKDKIQDTVSTAAEKNKDVKQKAADQITNAERAIQELETKLQNLGLLDSTSRAINTKGSGAVARSAGTEGGTGDAGIAVDEEGDPRGCPPGWSYNTEGKCHKNAAIGTESGSGATEHAINTKGTGTAGKSVQLYDNAKDHLDRAKKAFTEEKYGEAFGLARSAEVTALTALRISTNMTIERQTPKRDFGDKVTLPTDGIKDTLQTQVKEGQIPPMDGGAKDAPNVFPETNNRTMPVVPDVSNPTLTPSTSPALVSPGVLQAR